MKKAIKARQTRNSATGFKGKKAISKKTVSPGRGLSQPTQALRNVYVYEGNGAPQ